MSPAPHARLPVSGQALVRHTAVESNGRENVSRSAAWTCQSLPPIGALAWMLHSGPMLSITFGELSAPASDPFEGDITFYPNWYNTSRLGVLRERVFVAAPVSYSAYRFVKSLRGNRGYASY